MKKKIIKKEKVTLDSTTARVKAVSAQIDAMCIRNNAREFMNKKN